MAFVVVFAAADVDGFTVVADVCGSEVWEGMLEGVVEDELCVDFCDVDFDFEFCVVVVVDFAAAAEVVFEPDPGDAPGQSPSKMFPSITTPSNVLGATVIPTQALLMDFATDRSPF